MTYPRVNLLKKSELRYQGAVSQSFILLCGIGAPALIIALIIGGSFFKAASVKAQLSSSQTLWENLEPRVKEYREESKDLSTGGKVLDLFEGWQNSQVSFVDLLDEVQRAVPGTVQFSRLSIRSEDTKPVYKSAEEIQINYSLTIDGIAYGAEAEKQVLVMQKDLRGADPVGSIFGSVKLASMRLRQTEAGESSCNFRLIGDALEGGAK